MYITVAESLRTTAVVFYLCIYFSYCFVIDWVLLYDAWPLYIMFAGQEPLLNRFCCTAAVLVYTRLYKCCGAKRFTLLILSRRDTECCSCRPQVRGCDIRFRSPCHIIEACSLPSWSGHEVTYN